MIIIQERQDRQYDYHTYEVSLLYIERQDRLRLLYRNDKTGSMTTERWASYTLNSKTGAKTIIQERQDRQYDYHTGLTLQQLT